MRALGFLWLALLTGCAAIQPVPVSSSRPAQLESVAFVLNGRVAVNQQGARHSAGLRWTHQTQTDEILLLAPLGKTVARIYRDTQQATLEQGDKHYQAENIETLMQQVLGWRLPLTGLHYWVLGLPVADSRAQIERDANGQITVLRQDGWEVRYLHYADTSPDSLPARLQLTHEDLQVQLLIDEWQWLQP
ncbi:MAG TPA: lipoprotein insertase outer membrane protein LolB [Gallionella sp.]|nr:lipoprotein insertase outer membrane protein LolB [Gallionella sp.]